MPSEKHNLTKTMIQYLPIPETGRLVYYDGKTPGFAVRITSRGVKSFIVYRKVNGRPQRITLGRFPDLSVEQARKMAQETLGQIAKGENPQERKREKRGEFTLGQFFQEYLKRHAKPHKRTWPSDQTRYDLYLKPWRNRALSSISRADIQALHARIKTQRGPYAANRLLSFVQLMFKLARNWGFYQGDNPATGIRKYKEKSRDRFLQTDELPRFFKGLDEEPNEIIRDYVAISLLTGARKGNVLSMRWDEIVFERQTWTIPETKNGTALTIPLMPDAMDILKARKGSSESEFVFPGPGKSGHLKEPKKGWKRILERAGIKDLRIHDLRRTLGSYQAATGANLSVIGKTLGHKNVATTAVYARLNLDPVRKAMETATNAILAAGGVKPRDNGASIDHARKEK